MQIRRSTNLIPFLFPWIFSTFTSTAATLDCSSSACLPLHAACHTDSAECLWHCHLDVMSYFFPVTQRRCLPTGLSATQQLELHLMHFADGTVGGREGWGGLGNYNPVKKRKKINQSVRRINTASYWCSVSGWNGKPQAEPGWDSPGGDRRVSLASVC